MTNKKSLETEKERTILGEAEGKNLCQRLLGILDEAAFFGELASSLSSSLGVSSFKVYKVEPEGPPSLLICSHDIGPEKARKNLSTVIHLLKNKRAYFSNDISRDPLYNSNKEDLEEGAELAIPLVFEEQVMATLHFKAPFGKKLFSRADVSFIQEIFTAISLPLTNLKLYSSALSLNKLLQSKIEKKDQELKIKSHGLDVLETFKTIEHQIISQSVVFKGILDICDRVANTDVPIVLYGESGTGKGLIAKRIHCRSERREGPYIFVNCDSYKDEESLFLDLFGDASIQKKGFLELADQGTLVLQSLESLPLTLQARLADFMNIGVGIRPKNSQFISFKSDIRFIVQTSSDLSKKVESGEFREDLYYYVNTITICIPPLREHLEDLDALANYFLNLGKGYDEQKTFSSEALTFLMGYTWPGNITELKRSMEQVSILCDGPVVEVRHLDSKFQKNELRRQQLALEEELEGQEFLALSLGELERQHIYNTVKHCRGNKTKASKILGITVKTLYNKLVGYGLSEMKFEK